MAIIVLSAIAQVDGTAAFRFRRSLSVSRFSRILALGLPAAVQITLEIGLFSLMTAVAGRFAIGELAAHHVAISIIGTIFMIPLGIASAGAVRVGQAVGKGNLRRLRFAGLSSLGLAILVMAAASLVLLAARQHIVGFFTRDPAVIETASRLLLVAAALQVLDGCQVVATGLLRGVGDTRSPMRWNLIAHWLIGVPVGLGLGLGLQWGVLGLWLGLYSGVSTTGIVLTTKWLRLTNRLERDPHSLDRLAAATQGADLVATSNH
jgi:MATE family multidrug resistance protein